MSNLQEKVDQFLEEHDAVDVLEAMAVTLEAQANDAAAKSDGRALEDYQLDLQAVRAALAVLPETSWP